MTTETRTPEWPGGVHPAAELFPIMQGAEFDAFLADVASRGIRSPALVLPDGRLLDGRNRYKACVMLGIDLPTEVYRGTEPTREVVSANRHRRNLSPSQLALIGLEVEKHLAAEAKERQALAGKIHGRGQIAFLQLEKSVSGAPVHATLEAAKMVGVGKTSFFRAKTVARDAPELIPEIVAGTLTVGAAYEKARKQKPASPSVRIEAEPTVTPLRQPKELEPAQRGFVPQSAFDQVVTELSFAIRLKDWSRVEKALQILKNDEANRKRAATRKTKEDLVCSQ